MDKSITLKGFSYSYQIKGFPSIIALSDVTIKDILPGEIVCIIGPNGSGKTTLLDTIVGKLPIQKGQGQILMEDSVGTLVPTKLKLAYIPQKPFQGLVHDLSIIENLVFKQIANNRISFKKAITKEKKLEIETLLKEFGFEFFIQRFDTPPDALSGGEQQIVNLLSAIFSNPDMIVLDEPTSKLDEVNRIKLWGLALQAAHRNNMPLICASHDHDMVGKIADRIITLRNGIKADEQPTKNTVGSERFIGEIRRSKKHEDLPGDFQLVEKEWWSSNNLFGEDYYIGDDSDQGYLASKPMSRDMRTMREVAGIMRIASLNPSRADKILDAPCGWGRHSIELAKKGFNVVGIDLSDEFIRKAKETSEKSGLKNVAFEKGDMRNLTNIKDNTFDLIINIWSSFGFFDEKENLKTLKEFSRVLRPGGLLLVHTDHNPERVRSGIFDEPWERDLNDGSKVEVKEYYCENEHSIYGTWHISNRPRVYKYKMIVYSITDWKRMAQAASFSIEKRLGSLDKADELLTDRSQEFIILLRKLYC